VNKTASTYMYTWTFRWRVGRLLALASQAAASSMAIPLDQSPIWKAAPRIYTPEIVTLSDEIHIIELTTHRPI